MSQMLTPGTRACALFGAAVGVVFAVLCLTIGVGKAVLINCELFEQYLERFRRTDD